MRECSDAKARELDATTDTQGGRGVSGGTRAKPSMCSDTGATQGAATVSKVPAIEEG
jgi:hypothetical protein